MDDGILSFSESTSLVASCVECARKHAQRMRFSLTPDFELCEFDRNNMVYEKEHLLIDGTGKYPDYSFWHVAGKTIDGKDKGEAQNENKPENVRSLLP